MAGCCCFSSGSGFLGKVVDAVLLLFFGVGALLIPLTDAQVCLQDLVEFPSFLTDLKAWYASEFSDYLVAERPLFFRGLVWMELLFLWPLSIAATFAILTGRRRFFQIASLITGVSCATSLAAIMGELLGSGRAPDKLIKLYASFAGFALLATLRGLVPCSPNNASSAGSSDGARNAGKKKRA